MPRLRLVPLVRANDGFHARVLVARLGAEGILARVRGEVDGPYPVGSAEVLVAEDDLDAARELLLADEVEAAFPSDGAGGDHEGEHSEGDELDAFALSSLPSTPRWVVVAAVVLLAVLVLSLVDGLG